MRTKRTNILHKRYKHVILYIKGVIFQRNLHSYIFQMCIDTLYTNQTKRTNTSE